VREFLSAVNIQTNSRLAHQQPALTVCRPSQKNDTNEELEKLMDEATAPDVTAEEIARMHKTPKDYLDGHFVNLPALEEEASPSTQVQQKPKAKCFHSVKKEPRHLKLSQAEKKKPLSFKKAGKSGKGHGSEGSRKKRVWTEKEDSHLRQAVTQHGTDWRRVAAAVGTRNYTQCMQRWKSVLQPGLVKGAWSEKEDALLQQAIRKHTKKGRSWDASNRHEVAAGIRGRNGKQCYERWQLKQKLWGL
jgi:hypothetical protein